MVFNLNKHLVSTITVAPARRSGRLPDGTEFDRHKAFFLAIMENNPDHAGEEMKLHIQSAIDHHHKLSRYETGEKKS